MASLSLGSAILLNAIVIVLSTGCQEDNAVGELAGQILCTVNKDTQLPSPPAAIIHCETNLTGGLVLKQRDAFQLQGNNTRWQVMKKACLLRRDDALCTHLLIRLDSIPEQRKVEVCTFTENQNIECTCVDLRGKSLFIRARYLVSWWNEWSVMSP